MIKHTLQKLPTLSLIAIFALFSLQSCISFSSDKEEGEEEVFEESSSSDNDSNSDSPIGQLKDVAKKMEKFAEDLEEGKDIEVVNFRDLKDLLPEKIAGIKRTEASGETTGTMGFKISTAKGEYRDEDGQRIEVTIADAGGISMAIMGMAAWSMAEIDRESDSEIERTTTYKGHKAFEKYNKDSRRGEKALIVKDRFVVTVNGRDIDMKDLDRALDRIDIDDLEDMAK